MNYEGMIYRPPSEARSLILQVTVGCAHNKCTFCNMYKEKRFHIKPIDLIEADLAEARRYYGNRIARIFLADGDALALGGTLNGDIGRMLDELKLVRQNEWFRRESARRL